MAINVCTAWQMPFGTCEFQILLCVYTHILNLYALKQGSTKIVLIIRLDYSSTLVVFYYSFSKYKFVYESAYTIKTMHSLCS